MRQREQGSTTRGIGAFLIGIDCDASKDAQILIDSLRVYSSDFNYIDGFNRTNQ